MAGGQKVLLIWVLKEPWALNDIGDFYFLTVYSLPPREDRFGLSSPFKSIALGRVIKNFEIQWTVFTLSHGPLWKLCELG